LSKGADVNALWSVPEANVLMTPLCLACLAGQQEIVALLVESGATLNATDKVRCWTSFFCVPNLEIDLRGGSLKSQKCCVFLGVTAE